MNIYVNMQQSILKLVKHQVKGSHSKSGVLSQTSYLERKSCQHFLFIGLEGNVMLMSSSDVFQWQFGFEGGFGLRS